MWDHDDVNKKVHDSCASAMQLNAAPMSYSEYSTPQMPLMPPTFAHNNAHNNAAPQDGAEQLHQAILALRARFDAGHFRLQTRDAC